MARAEVKFIVKFMDWQKGDTAQLKKERAEHYAALGVCATNKPQSRKKKKTAPTPSNKMATGAATK